MTPGTDYKTVKNGSIDYAHYMNHSRAVRSHAAHALVKTVWRWAMKHLRPVPSPQNTPASVIPLNNRKEKMRPLKNAA